MNNDPLVPWPYVAAFVRTAGLIGVPLGNIVNTLEYSLLAKDKFIPSSSVMLLCERVLNKAPFNTLLPITSVMGFEGMSELPTIVLLEKSPRDALESIFDTKLPARYGIHLQETDPQNTTHVIFKLDFPSNSVAHRYRAEWLFGIVIQLVASLGLSSLPILEIHLDYDPGEFTSEYISGFDASQSIQLKKNQADIRIIMEKKFLDSPIHSSQTELANDAKASLSSKKQHLEQGEYKHSIEAQVRSIIIKELKTGIRPNIETVASSLNLSTRSLQRKLTDTNNNFSEIKSQILVEETKDLLSSSNLSLDQIANKLGFSDRTTLSATFKRIEEISPAQFRKSLLENK